MYLFEKIFIIFFNFYHFFLYVLIFLKMLIIVSLADKINYFLFSEEFNIIDIISTIFDINVHLKSKLLHPFMSGHL